MTDQVSTFVRPKLDPDLYSCLEDNEIAFFKEQTGIADSIALKDHIIAVQAEGYEVGRVVYYHEPSRLVLTKCWPVS